MPLEIVALTLKIILVAMEGQTPEQRARMWEAHLADMEKLRHFLHLDA